MDGARLRVAVWGPTASARGVCALLSGQTEFIEKYCEVIDELRGRGFAVAALDWRGQGGSSRALADPLKVHIGSFAEYDTDLLAFMDQVVRPLSSAPIVLAHSMGAHILLRGLHNNPGLFSAAVMTAPMLAVSTRGTPRWLAALMTKTMNVTRAGAEDYVIGMRERDPLRMTFEQNLVSTDRARWARTQDILKKSPQIRLAGPTWGWLKQAGESMRAMASPGYAEAIATRSLLVGAGRDRIVLTPPIRDFARRMPNAAYIEIAEAEHEILMETDPVRRRFWQAFDQFLDGKAFAGEKAKGMAS